MKNVFLCDTLIAKLQRSRFVNILCWLLKTLFIVSLAYLILPLSRVKTIETAIFFSSSANAPNEKLNWTIRSSNFTNYKKNAYSPPCLHHVRTPELKKKLSSQLCELVFYTRNQFIGRISFSLDGKKRPRMSETESWAE